MAQKTTPPGVPGNKHHSIAIRVFSDIYARCREVYGWPESDARKAGSLVSTVVEEQKRASQPASAVN